MLLRYNYLLSVYLCERHRLVRRHGLKRTDFLPLPCAAESLLLLSAAATFGACAVPGTVPDCAVRCAGQTRSLKVQSEWDLIGRLNICTGVGGEIRETTQNRCWCLITVPR